MSSDPVVRDRIMAAIDRLKGGSVTADSIEELQQKLRCQDIPKGKFRTGLGALAWSKNQYGGSIVVVRESLTRDGRFEAERPITVRRRLRSA